MKQKQWPGSVLEFNFFLYIYTPATAAEKLRSWILIMNAP